MFKTATEDLISFNSYGTLKRKGSKNERNCSFLSKKIGIYGKYILVFAIYDIVVLKLNKNETNDSALLTVLEYQKKSVQNHNLVL